MAEELVTLAVGVLLTFTVIAEVAEHPFEPVTVTE
jgi:hypothetical protein